MVNGQRLFKWTALILVIALMLVACERPLQRDTVVEEPIVEEVEEIAEPETVEEVEEEVEEQPPRPEATPVVEPEPEEDVVEEETPEVVEPVEEEAVEEEAVEEEVVEEEAVEEVVTEETTAPLPDTHTVVAGENLYRIGLKYGLSWVVLAQYNNIANPNDIKAGQVLRIPTTDAEPAPTPSPALETTYTVRAGDNLFRIGLAYGINWTQIAEANGIVNPNQIYAGQVLKIPVSAPGPAPQFTHTVQRGETLFLISLRYGVPWPAIAEANNLTPPYVIYVGQTLVIPGG